MLKTKKTNRYKVVKAFVILAHSVLISAAVIAWDSGWFRVEPNTLAVLSLLSLLEMVLVLFAIDRRERFVNAMEAHPLFKWKAAMENNYGLGPTKKE